MAMNRRLFCRKLWFPIISLNSEYIRQSPDRILAFALEHEFEMSRIYQEISSRQKTVSPDEKRDIMISAQEISQKKLTITPEELIEDERLMHQLSLSSPLLPKPYAEMALLHYLEANFPRLEPFGQKSASPEEEALGKELAEEFSSWSDFSTKTYELFVREIAANLREMPTMATPESPDYARKYLYSDHHQFLVITILKEISIWQNPISNLRLVQNPKPRRRSLRPQNRRSTSAWWAMSITAKPLL